MSEDTYLKDNIKKCVDYVMNKNDEDKRRILTGIFQYNDYLLNEQLVIKVLNDKEKQEWFNNEMFDIKDKEIERLNNIINEITKMIKDDYFKAYNYTKKIEQSGKPQGDYPVYYYYNLKKKELTDEYLNRIEELKGSDKE